MCKSNYRRSKNIKINKRSYETYEEHKSCQMFFDIIDETFQEDFLWNICNHIYMHLSSTVLGKNKFAEVKKNLFDFS